MAPVVPCAYLQQRTDHTALNDRQVVAGLVLGSSAGGVASAADCKVTAQGTPNMTLNVATGHCFIPGTEALTQGMYHGYNDATYVVTVTASNPTLPRIDLVVARVRDAFYSGANSDWDIIVVAGTAAGSPVPPAAPNNSIILAQIAVGANVTSITNANITDKRALMGDIEVVTSTTRPGVPTQGQIIYETDSGSFLGYDGTNWQFLFDNGGWTTYTPTVTGSTTNPTMTVNGRYKKIGKTCFFYGGVTVVTALGSGTYAVALPFPYPANMGDIPIGLVRYRTNAGLYVLGSAELASGGGSTFTVLVETPSGANPNLVRWASTAPASQINGDTWAWSGFYETT